MEMDAVLSRNPSAAYRLYEGQATIVLLERAEVKVANEVGSFVWDRIDGRRTLGEIVRAVVEEYEVDEEEARRDVLEFVADLRAQGMVS
jgi:hypothetical protein